MSTEKLAQKTIKSKCFSDQQLFFSVPQLARIFGVSRYTIYSQIRKKAIPFKRVGRQFFIPKSFINLEKEKIASGTI